MSNLFQKCLKNRLLIIGLAVLFIIITIIFVFWSVSIPLDKIRAYNLEYGKQKEGQICYDDPSLKNTVRDIAYLEAYIAMAKNDSIGLILNLQDSIIGLVLKGVIIHSSKIISISNDGFFNALDVCTYKNLFSLPVSILNQKATIEKEPVVVKKAPKNEAEATQAPYYPDTLKNKRIADIELTLNPGFKLFIHDGSAGCEQANENISTPGEIWRNMKRFILLKKPEYRPAIHICIDKRDAISIYRALPGKALAIIKI